VTVTSWLLASLEQLFGRRRLRSLIVFGLLVILAGCAHHYELDHSAEPYGFFSGIWHGFIFPYALLTNLVSWVLSFGGLQFLAGIEIIGRPNTGVFFYYIGFFFGLSPYGSGAAR
jgi:hypothetical protein